MKAFGAIVGREIVLAVKSGGAGLALSFFILTIMLLPFGVGAEPETLARLGPGFVWLAALLAQLLTLERLVQADLEDGTLDLLVGAELPLSLAFVAKALGHWLCVGLPLTLLSPVAGLLLGLDSRQTLGLALSLLVGLPGLAALGTLLAALTAGVRRGSLILALLTLPLGAPYLIFGGGVAGGRGISGLLFLGALSLFSCAMALILGPSSLRSQTE
jgi:heme exporter protein B